MNSLLLFYLFIAIDLLVASCIILYITRRPKDMSEPTLPMPVEPEVKTVSERDKPFYLTVFGGLGMLSTFLIGAYGAFLGNEALVDWARYGFIAFTGFFSTGFAWYINQNKKE